MPPSLRAFFVLAFLRAFLRVLSVSALKEALSLPELTRRPRLPVAANLENSRQWVSVGGLHFHTHRLHFRRLKARREHTPGGQKQESSTAAQAYALAPPTPRQSGARASPAKAECPARQQTGHRTGLGLEGDLLPFLEVQIRDVGRRLSRLLVLPGHAEPPGADEKGGPHAARP